MLVGVSNALLHFSILNISFSIIGLSKITSSITATVCAMFYSFVLNRNFVFKSNARRDREVVLFIAVTVLGVLVIHNLAYLYLNHLLDNHDFLAMRLESISGNTLSRDSIKINLSTVGGASIALLWNYIGYKYIVFNKQDIDEKE